MLMDEQPTILVIDDDPAMQTVLEIVLREAGYRVEVAGNGQEGVTKLVSLRPNLVICDIMMPQMDGVEAFQRMKDQLQEEGIPIFIITALNRRPWFADLEAEGAVIIQKPFEIKQMLNLIQTMLN
jgi:CheY-like chemotaxis protein